MSIQRNSDIPIIRGNEGTLMKQYFHPENTLNEIGYSLAQFTIKPGKRSLLHRLQSSEVYYILEGEGVLKIGKESFKVKKDDSVFVPPKSDQFIENHGKTDLRFLCIVDPSWQKKDEEILE